MGRAGPEARGLFPGPFRVNQHDPNRQAQKPDRPNLRQAAFVFVLARGGCGRGASALPL